MPLLEINLSRHITPSVRLHESAAEQVDQYAAFIQASQAMLWTRCSTIVFLQDHDFQEFHKTPLAEQLVSTLRIRRGPSKGGAQQTAKKHAARVESTTSAWMS